MSKKRYRRGDWNPEGTKRFWSYVRGSEGWLAPRKFQEAIERTRFWQALAWASPKSLKIERRKHKKKNK